MLLRPGTALLAAACLLVSGCYSRSYPVARVTPNAIYFDEPTDPLEVIGDSWPVQEEECAFQLPLVVFSRADVRRVMSNLFEENDGDAIVNAELYMFHLPLVVWDDSCVGIRGDMVKIAR